ncbi:hypothetical protein [Streptomyces sp. FH025]|uniref:hypothetical protein n=1 Tax=Streptomyces sp. FH025 TaxID=2815937 RepID=UPI001A9E765A|nr:hypothetical protein [Streptomyces sp. FH025]MBO1414894.1 hypothetical protein [Streptomyces sp. FH025]
MIAVIVLVVVGLVLLFPVVMTRLAKRKLAQLERAKATIAAHEERLAEERQAQNTIIPEDHGLLLGKDLVLFGGPGPEEAAALDAAKAGDWRPIATHLAEDGTPDVRWRRLFGAADLAAQDDTWLRAWREERPQDPTAALLHADALVALAWTIRTSARASDVTREQFQGFHRVLTEAEQACAEAAALAPDDPNPWAALIGVAMGLNYPNDRFRELWAELTKRDPHHWGAHNRALQYWCQKWHGSHEAMHAFIDEAIAAAPVGSLLAPIKLEAFWEQFVRDRENTPASWQRPEVGAALDAALADLAAADPAGIRITYTRGWLAYGLTKAGRHTEALEQFQALGRFIPPPFTGFNDPRQFFIDLRIDAVKGAVAAKEAARQQA